MEVCTSAFNYYFFLENFIRHFWHIMLSTICIWRSQLQLWYITTFYLHQISLNCFRCKIMTHFLLLIGQVPAIIYVFSFIVSVILQVPFRYHVYILLNFSSGSCPLLTFLKFILQEIVWTGQRLKIYYSAGGVLWMVCGAVILILPTSMSAFMYVMSSFIGVANALMTVCLSLDALYPCTIYCSNLFGPLHTKRIFLTSNNLFC